MSFGRVRFFQMDDEFESLEKVFSIYRIWVDKDREYYQFKAVCNIHGTSKIFPNFKEAKKWCREQNEQHSFK